MKYIHLLVAAFSTFLVGLASAEHKVVAWNVQSNWPGRVESDPALIAQQMADKDPVDIWGLSEVLDKEALDLFEAALESRHGRDYEAFLSDSGGRDRLAILFDKGRYSSVGAPFEIAEVAVTSGLRPAYAVTLEDKASGERFVFVVNHLKCCGDGESKRVRQCKALNKFAEESDLPVIAVGDYNIPFDPDHGEGDALPEELVVLTQKGPYRWVKPDVIVATEDSHMNLLDYVFVARAPEGWTGSSMVLKRDGNEPAKRTDPFRDDSRNSDHRPVFASVSFRGADVDGVPKSEISVSEERDRIYMLLAYSVVEANWQYDSDTRGYNIGGVLVDDSGMPVSWARNCTSLCGDKTQHGEVRLMQDFIRSSQRDYLDGYTIYTTLEPCMMCSGMMVFLKTSRVVYGQQDPSFGLNIERLRQSIDYEGRQADGNSRARNIVSEQSKLPLSQRLDELFADYSSSNITMFLRGSEALEVYRQARNELAGYVPVHDENVEALEAARALLETAKVKERSSKDCPNNCGCPEDQAAPEAAMLGTGVKIRVVASNLTSGRSQSYDLGHGARILEGLKPDIALMQEFEAEDLGGFVKEAFGEGFVYMIENEPDGGLPNGVVSRFPILESGEWEDPHMSNRDFAWARIDIPGPIDLWAVSVHFKAGGASRRRASEAGTLVEYVKGRVPEGDFLVIGGDFNTSSYNERCIGILDAVVSSRHRPSDKAGRQGTNASRRKPYDLVLPDLDLERFHVPVAIGSLPPYESGLVFDTRVFPDLALVSPAQAGDSSAQAMQHMAVVKDFIVPGDN